MLFRSLTKGICLVLINNVLLNLLCVWIMCVHTLMCIHVLRQVPENKGVALEQNAEGEPGASVHFVINWFLVFVGFFVVLRLLFLLLVVVVFVSLLFGWWNQFWWCLLCYLEHYQYTTSVDINNTCYKRLRSLIQSHMCAVSLLKSRESYE